MHQALLEAAKELQPPVDTFRIRLVANAAGPLSHALAMQLKQRFT